jgi:hypothetical protein
VGEISSSTISREVTPLPKSSPSNRLRAQVLEHAPAKAREADRPQESVVALTRSMPVQRIVVSAIFTTLIWTTLSTKAVAVNCQNLKSFTFPNTTIIDAKEDFSGKYGSKDVLRLTFTELPPSCRVTAKITPTKDSDIKCQPSNITGAF